MAEGNSSPADRITPFQEASFPDIEAYFPSSRERAAQYARRSRIALLYSLGLAASSVALTVAGMVAAMWHMGPWIALDLLAVVVLSVALVGIVIAHTFPPESDSEKSLKLRRPTSSRR